MPVQINEVVIKAVVENAPSSASSSSSSSGGGTLSSEDIATKILEIIREKTER